MNALAVRICSHQDLDLLARLNKQLIEDEMHDNPMNIDQLKDRMAGFLNSDYKAYLFVEGDSEVNRRGTGSQLQEIERAFTAL